MVGLMRLTEWDKSLLQKIAAGEATRGGGFLCHLPRRDAISGQPSYSVIDTKTGLELGDLSETAARVDLSRGFSG